MESSISTAGQVRGGAQRNNDDDSVGPALVTSKKPSSVSFLAWRLVLLAGQAEEWGVFHTSALKCAADGQACQHRLVKPTAKEAEGGRSQA